MRLVKPSWVEHTGQLTRTRCRILKLIVSAGEKKTKGTVYSLSVHPDGTRLATGGVGGSQISITSDRILLVLYPNSQLIRCR